MPRWSRSKRHNVLDEIIVEKAEIDIAEDDELFNGNVAISGRTPSASDDATPTGVHDSAAAQRTGGPEPPSSPANITGRNTTSVIMMYSPYIPSIEELGTANSPQTTPDIGNYYSRIDTEESVKCVVTSVLFCTVVVLIVLVAVFKNPGM